MEWLMMERWSPYVAGIGIGLLSWVAFLLSDKPLGCSTAFSRTSGMVERLFRGSKVEEKLYYKKFTPSVDWEWMLVLGVFIGAFLSAKLSGQFQGDWVPTKWAATFGNTPITRWIVALIGGIVMGIGARWAGGGVPVVTASVEPFNSPSVAGLRSYASSSVVLPRRCSFSTCFLDRGDTGNA